MDQVIIGVDTHKDNHVAVAIDTQGARPGSTTVSTTRKGYHDLEAWASQFGRVKAFGIEGSGSFGAGLSRHLLAKRHEFRDFMRPNRQLRYLHGKSDSLDAESAARSVLNAQAMARAKAQTGSSEMIRHLKVVRDSAVKAKSQAMITLKTVIINAPADLRDTLGEIRGRVALVRHVAAWRPGEITPPTASAKAAMRHLHYQNGENTLKIVPSGNGLPTIFDKDILIFYRDMIYADTAVEVARHRRRSAILQANRPRLRRSTHKSRVVQSRRHGLGTGRPETRNLLNINRSHVADRLGQIRALVSKCVLKQLETCGPFGCYQPKLSQMATQGIDKLRALSHHTLMRSECDCTALRFCALHCHKPHCRA